MSDESTKAVAEARVIVRGRAIVKLMEAHQSEDLNAAWFFIRDKHFVPAMQKRDRLLTAGPGQHKKLKKAEEELEKIGAMLGAIDAIRLAARSVTGA